MTGNVGVATGRRRQKTALVKRWPATTAAAKSAEASKLQSAPASVSNVSHREPFISGHQWHLREKESEVKSTVDQCSDR